MNPAYINSNKDEANIITMNNKCEDRKQKLWNIVST